MVPWDERKHVKDIKALSTRDDMSILDKAGNSFAVDGSTFKKYQTIVIEQEQDLFDKGDKQFEKLIYSSDRFISAYLYDADYAFVQSAISETVFEEREISKEVLGSLSKTPFKTSIFGKRDYAIKFNPGRIVYLNNSVIMAACKIWFGKPFFKAVPKNHLLSFPNAIEIKQMEGEIVYVHLFDKISESFSPESMYNQWKWQEWIDFDNLEEKYCFP